MKRIGIIILIFVIITTICCGFFGCSKPNNQETDTIYLDDTDVDVINDFNRKYSQEDIEKYYSLSADLMSYGDIRGCILYDLADRPTYLLKEYDGIGYEIINRYTGTSIERTDEGYSIYYGKNGKPYYAGFMNYFIEKDGEMVNLLDGGKLSETQQEFLIDFSNYIVVNDIEENMGVRENELALTTNEERENYTTLANCASYFEKLNIVKNDGAYLYAVASAYYKNSQGTYKDIKFPINTNDTCGQVATTILLQYYERNGIHVIPNAFLDTIQSKTIKRGTLSIFSYDQVYNFLEDDSNYAQYPSVRLHDKLFELTPVPGVNGCVTDELRTAISRLYSNYPVQANEILHQIITDYNTCYNNMVGAVDSNRPAVGMTGGTGNGYYKDANGNWTSKSTSWHHMVVYGYCTTQSGTLQDFVCHSGWYSENTQKMWVYKLNFLSNYTHSLQ